MSTHCKLPISDAELLHALERGRSLAQIAKEQGVTEPDVQSRLGQIRRGLAVPAAAPAGEAAGPFDGIAEVHKNHAVLDQLREACLRLLAAEDGESLDVGPHDYDLQVLVARKGAPPVRRSLNDLLGEKRELVASMDANFTDPRTLLLRTVAEIRQHVELAVKLSERLHDVRQAERFQQMVLACIERADPETAARIRDELREQRQLCRALLPPGPPA
jgi:hypothetical protein